MTLASVAAGFGVFVVGTLISIGIAVAVTNFVWWITE